MEIVLSVIKTSSGAGRRVTTSSTIISVATSTVVNVNERMNIFTSILCVRAVYDSDSSLKYLEPMNLTDEAKDLFASEPATSEHGQLVTETMVVLSDNIAKEKDYLSCVAK